MKISLIIKESLEEILEKKLVIILNISESSWNPQIYFVHVDGGFFLTQKTLNKQLRHEHMIHPLPKRL